MGSSTRVSEMPVEDLEHELNIAYQDLAFAMARVVAITWRVDPNESPMNAFGGALLYLGNGLCDKVLKEAESV